MTNPFAGAFGPTPQPQRPSPSNPFAGAFGEDTGEPLEAAKLRVATEQARATSPDKTAEALTLARRTGLPAGVVERNLDRVREMAGDRTFDPGQFVRENPVTAVWLTNPTNAAVAKDDYENLGTLERLIGRWRMPNRQDFAAAQATVGAARAGRAPTTPVPVEPLKVQAGLVEESFVQGQTGLALARIYANTTPAQREAPEVRQQIDALKGQLRELPGSQNVVERALRSAAGGFAPSMLAIGKEAAAGAMAGGSLGVTAAVVAGQLGPQALTPEEALTAPVFAAAGATVMGTAAAFNAAREIWAGELGQTLDEIRDANGRPLNAATQEVVKHGFGVLGGAFEVAGLGVITNRIAQAVGPKLVARGVQRGLSNALRQESVRRVALEAGKTYATAVAVETAEETLSEGLQIAGEALARSIGNVQGGQFSPVEGEAERLIATAVETFYGSLVLGGVAAGGVAIGGMARVTQAQAEAERFAEMVGVADASKLRTRDAQTFEVLLQEQIQAAGAPEAIGVPADRILEQAQAQGFDVAEFAQLVGTTPDAIQEAVAAGQDVMLPVAKVLANLTQTPAFAALQEDFRFRVGLPTIREAKSQEAEFTAAMEEVKADLEKAVKDADDPAQRIVDDMVAQVTAAAAGLPKSAEYTPQNIEAMAKTAAAFYSVVAKRQGRDAFELYRERNYRILGPEDAQRVLTLRRDLQRAVKKGDLQAASAVQAELATLVGAPMTGEPMTQEALPDTIDVDGVQRPTTNSDGQPIHPTAEGVRNFWRWATEGGRQPIVDKNGLPVVMYHGTPTPTFTEFAANTNGIFAVSDPRVATEYTAARGLIQGAQVGAVYPLYVRTAQVRDVDAMRSTWDNLRIAGREWKQKVFGRLPEGAVSVQDVVTEGFANGADAVIVRNVRDVADPDTKGFADVVSVANPEDVKSAIGNTGAFGPSANILEQAPALSREDVDAYYADEAHSLMAQRDGATARDIADEMLVPVADVERWLSKPRPEIAPEDLRRTMLLLAFRPDAILEQAAFHGTPYTFDRFDLSAIGTGEGAQAYGWGLYFAESESVAGEYRKKLSAAVRFGDETIDTARLNNPTSTAGLYLARAHDMASRNPEESALRSVAVTLREASPPFSQEYIDATLAEVRRLAQLEYRGETQGGALYRVDIPDEAVARFLDWDKPLADQPEVLAKIREYVAEIKRLGLEQEGKDVIDAAEMIGMDGGFFYKMAQGAFGDKALSQDLNRFGIPGIKYLDAGSRGAGDGTRNLVVFDDALITITHRNGEPVTAQERTDFLAQEGQGVTQEQVQEFADGLRQSLGLDKMELFLEPNGDLALSFIVVPQERRSAGVGSEAMRQLIAFADARGLRVSLTPSGTNAKNTERLRKWYKQFGFRDNKGRTRDFSTKAAMLRDPQTAMLSQGGTAPNAFIIPGVSQQTIGLMNTANLSSLMHELSHDWLRILQADALRADASEQTLADWATITKHLNIPDSGELTVEAQEKWARDFERYLATADAPSRGLARAFVRFKGWMAKVYQRVKAMLLPVDPEIAGVFDRMLATEDELRLTRRANGAEPIILEDGDAETLGLSPEALREYRKAWALDAAEQNAALLKDLLAERSDEFKKVKREAEARIREDVQAEIGAQPVYQVLRYLTTGEIPPGVQMAGTEKLNRPATEAVYGDIAKSLPRGIWTSEGGLDADALALAFGFRDGFALIEAMQQAAPEKQAVAAEVRRRMAIEFPDPMQNSAILQEKAQDVAHRASTDDPIVRDLTLLGKAAGIRPPNVPAIKAVAKQMVGQMAVKDIRPVAFQNAEVTAARKSGEAFKKGDLQTAAFHKRQQLLNHILYREARKAVERANVVARYARRLSEPASQQRLGKAGQQYLNAANAVLDSYEFREVSVAQMQRRAALDAWVTRAIEDNGVAPAVPQSVLDDARTINYRQLTSDQLADVYDTLKQIDHFASFKGKLLKAQKQRTIADATDAIVGSIAEHHTIETRQPDYAPSKFRKLVDGIKKWDAWHVKPEFLFRWLDGENVKGAAHALLFQPIADAQNAEARMLKSAVPEIRALFDRIPKELRKQYDRKLTGPDIPQGFTREQAVALALNWGNEGNRTAVREAQIAKGQPHLTDANIRALLNVLTADEWQFVQGVWDYVDSFWPEIAALQQRIVGVAPDKIGADPFTWTTTGGQVVQLKGGYYPLSYDRTMSWSQRKAEAEGTVQEMAGGGFTRQLTKHGFTEARVGSGKKPVNLRLSVFPQHVVNVIHDLTHREAIIDVRKLAEQPDVREAIIGTAGPALYDSINPWLNRVAAEQTPPASPFEDLLGRARVGATMVNMGFKVTTAVVQPLGYLQSVDLIGVKYMRRGLQETLKNPKQVWETVKEWSPELESRRTQFDRDVKDAVDSFALKGWSPEVSQVAFWMTGTADMMVALPTFYGAYLKSMETINVGDHEASVKYAESVVRQSQSAGGAKDLAQIQGGPESRRIFTMFYSYFSVLYNLFRRSGSLLAQRGVSDLPRFVGSMAVLWFLPAVLGELVPQRGPEDDEDELAWTLEQIARYPFGAVVGVRDVAGGIASYLTQGRMFYDISPVVSAFESGVRAIGGVIQAVGGEPMTRAEIKALVEAAGYWGKLPSRQMWITGEALYDWMMGYDAPEGPLDAARDLVFPRPR